MCITNKVKYSKRMKVRKAYKIMMESKGDLYSAFYPATYVRSDWKYNLHDWNIYRKCLPSPCIGFYSLRKLSDARKILKRRWNWATEWGFLDNPKLVIAEVRISDIEYEGDLEDAENMEMFPSFISKKIKILKIVKE